MRIAGAALFMGATASFVLAAALPNGRDTVVAQSEPPALQPVDVRVSEIKPLMVKPESLFEEAGQAPLQQS